jgi:hypothetical protein
MYLVTFTVSQGLPKAAWHSGHRTISLLVRHKYVWYNGAQSLLAGRRSAKEWRSRAHETGATSGLLWYAAEGTHRWG